MKWVDTVWRSTLGSAYQNISTNHLDDIRNSLSAESGSDSDGGGSRGDGCGIATSGTAVAASLSGLPRSRLLPRGGASLPSAAAAMATHSNVDILLQYMCNKTAARHSQRGGTYSKFRSVHRLVQFPISDRSDCREGQAFPGIWTGPLNFVMYNRWWRLRFCFRARTAWFQFENGVDNFQILFGQSLSSVHVT